MDNFLLSNMLNKFIDCMQDKQIWQGLNQKDAKTFEYIYDIFYSDLIRYGQRSCQRGNS